jgi:hypothetical protein
MDKIPPHTNQRCTMTPMEGTQMTQDDELKYRRKICQLEIELSEFNLRTRLLGYTNTEKFTSSQASRIRSQARNCMTGDDAFLKMINKEVDV